MEIEIREDGSSPLLVTIRCPRADSSIRRLAAYIGLFDCPLQAKDGAETRFLILLTAFGMLHDAETVTLRALVFLLLWCAGAVLLFCLFFTRLVLRRMGFTPRLVIFMGLISVYQLLLPIWRINSLHFLFEEQFPLLYGGMTFGGMLIYILIIAVLCGACLTIYHVYSRRKGALYTQALQKYQAEHANS